MLMVGDYRDLNTVIAGSDRQRRRMFFKHHRHQLAENIQQGFKAQAQIAVSIFERHGYAPVSAGESR